MNRKTGFMLVMVALVLMLPAVAFAQNPTMQPDPMPDPTAMIPTTAPSFSGGVVAPTEVAPVVPTESPADVLFGFTVEQVVLFLVAAATLVMAIVTAVRQGSPSTLDARLAEIIQARASDPNLITPAERLYNRSVPQSQKEVIDAIFDGAGQFFDRALPERIKTDNALFSLAGEVIDGSPLAEKIKEQDERIAALEQAARQTQPDMVGFDDELMAIAKETIKEAINQQKGKTDTDE